VLGVEAEAIEERLKTYAMAMTKRLHSELQVRLPVPTTMISYIYNQSCTERAGRNMDATKSPDRRSLGDIAFTDLVWLSFNAPPTHQVNFRPIVLAWQASNHRLAVQENGNGSQVLKRHLNKEKNTILK